MIDTVCHSYQAYNINYINTNFIQNRRKGISTIVGSIIFIGILLSSIIPMYLVMKQADTIYFQKQSEMLMKDQDKMMEQIEFIRTVPWNDRFLNMTIKNNGPKLLNITYMGAYNITEIPTYSPVQKITAVGSQQNITISMEFNYDIKNKVPDGTYLLELVTDKGNKFITIYPDKNSGHDGEYGGDFNATVTKIIGDFVPDYHSFAWALRPNLETSGFDWQQNWNLPGTIDYDVPMYILTRMNVTYYGAWKGNFTLSNKVGLYLLRTDPYDYTMPHTTTSSAFMFIVNNTGSYNNEAIQRYSGESVTKVTQYKEFTLYFGVTRVGTNPTINGAYLDKNATYMPIMELYDSTGAYGQSFPLVAISTGGALDHFEISKINSPQTSGKTIPVTISAVDINGNTVSSYSDTNTLSDSSGTISPTTAQFSHGVWSGSVTISHAATSVIISTTGGGKTGTSNSFETLPTGFDHFAISPIASPKVAGTPFQITINAVDINDNLISSYTGTVSLTVTAPGTINPSPTSAFVNGVWTGSVTLIKTGIGVTITATDLITTKSGVSNIFDVNPGALASFSISGYPTSISSGQNFGTNNVVVRAYDFWGNIKTDYTGKVWFTSNDPLATLPYYASNHAYTFTSSDSGVHTFSGTGFTLKTKWTTIKIFATNGSITQSSNNIKVN